MTEQTLEERIRAQAATFSKGQRRLAEYMSEQGSTSALLTAASLAKAVGVSEATVVRFSQALGYSGYPELRRDLGASLRMDVTTLSRFSSTLDSAEGSSIVDRSLREDLTGIQRTAATLDEDQLLAAAQTVMAGGRVWVVGALMSFPAAHLLRTGLRMIGVDSNVLDGSIGSPGLEFQGCGTNDVLVSVALRRYNAGTVDVVELARREGITCIAITDDVLSPTATRSGQVLLVAPTEQEFFQSTTSVISAVTALVTACSLRRPEESREVLAGLEKRWANSQTFVDR
jgi:DNA-binding MurR/RpiR family transcriptional regulator